MIFDINRFTYQIICDLMEKNKQYWKDKCPFDYEFID